MFEEKHRKRRRDITKVNITLKYNKQYWWNKANEMYSEGKKGMIITSSNIQMRYYITSEALLKNRNQKRR